MYFWSILDKKRFGLKTARLNLNEEVVDVNNIIQSFITKKGQLFIVKCNSLNNEMIFQLQKKGFFLTDTMLTFSRSSIIKSEDVSDLCAEIAYARPSDSSLLADLAQRSFANYRGHYHHNPLLDNKLCDEVYTDWARRLCIDKSLADEVFLAMQNGKYVGFASLKVDEKGIAKGGLLGVIPEYRGKGISRFLHIHRLLWCSNKNVKEIQVEISLNNKMYINLLIQMGFKLEYSNQVFHLNNF